MKLSYGTPYCEVFSCARARLCEGRQSARLLCNYAAAFLEVHFLTVARADSTQNTDRLPPGYPIFTVLVYVQHGKLRVSSVQRAGLRQLLAKEVFGITVV